MRRLALVVALLVAPAAVARDAQGVVLRHGRTIVVADDRRRTATVSVLAPARTIGDACSRGR